MTSEDAPYRALDIAIITRAVDDLRGCQLNPPLPAKPTRRAMKDRQVGIDAFKDAAHWMFGTDERHHFSLEETCMRLGLRPALVRAKALKGLPEQKIEEIRASCC